MRVVYTYKNDGFLMKVYKGRQRKGENIQNFFHKKKKLAAKMGKIPISTSDVSFFGFDLDQKSLHN
jgi:hypothetical protein